MSPYRAALVAAASAAVALAALPAPTAHADQAPAGWRPDVAAARAYAESRRGDISFAVAVPGGRLWGDRIRRTVPSASVLKAMLLVAYLDHPSVRRRALRASDLDLLSPMIRRSDNATATRVRAFVGARRLRKLARRAGMRRFIPASTRAWGSSRIDAEDQARFFLGIDRRIVPRHRSLALRLLRRVVPSQRWGVGRVPPAGWELYFKGGWGSGTGAVDHQVALLRRAGTRVAVAVLTVNDGSHAYGKETLRGMFKRLLRGLEVSLR